MLGPDAGWDDVAAQVGAAFDAVGSMPREGARGERGRGEMGARGDGRGDGARRCARGGVIEGRAGPPRLFCSVPRGEIVRRREPAVSAPADGNH